MVTSNNIELLTLTPGTTNGTINVIGDNNGAIANQVDEFLFFGGDVDSTLPGGDGDGANEMLLLINGSNPIALQSVGLLNITGAGGDDEITIDPWADNSTAGWGVHVNVDGGAGNDGVYYGNIERDTTNQPGILFADNTPDGARSGVSEDVVLAATTTAGASQLRVSNATDDSNILTADLTTVEDVAFFLNDTAAGDDDTLTILGTAGVDTVTADLTNVGLTFAATTNAITNGGVGEELVDLDAGGSQIVQVHSAVRATAGAAGTAPTLGALPAIAFSTGAGDDTLTLTGRATASNVLTPTIVNVDLGTPLASDTLVLTGTMNADDDYVITPGASNDPGHSARSLSPVRRQRSSTFPVRKIFRLMAAEGPAKTRLR